jgi:hypothetical protein
MSGEEQVRLDAFVNSCVSFVHEKGKVRSIPGQNNTSCLQMTYETTALTVLVNVIIPPHKADRFCIIFVREAENIVLFGTGFYDDKRAYGVRAVVRAPSKWESVICAKYPMQ